MNQLNKYQKWTIEAEVIAEYTGVTSDGIRRLEKTFYDNTGKCTNIENFLKLTRIDAPVTGTRKKAIITVELILE